MKRARKRNYRIMRANYSSDALRAYLAREARDAGTVRGRYS